MHTRYAVWSKAGYIRTSKNFTYDTGKQYALTDDIHAIRLYNRKSDADDAKRWLNYPGAKVVPVKVDIPNEF